jgi:hypothetical protein
MQKMWAAKLEGCPPDRNRSPFLAMEHLLDRTARVGVVVCWWMNVRLTLSDLAASGCLKISSDESLTVVRKHLGVESRGSLTISIGNAQDFPRRMSPMYLVDSKTIQLPCSRKFGSNRLSPVNGETGRVHLVEEHFRLWLAGLRRCNRGSVPEVALIVVVPHRSRCAPPMTCPPERFCWRVTPQRTH